MHVQDKENKNYNGDYEIIEKDKIVKIFFDHHGKGIEFISANKKDFCYKSTLIPYGGTSYDFISLQNPDKFLPYKMLESGLLKILIIDERIINWGKIKPKKDDVYHKACISNAKNKEQCNIDVAWGTRVMICNSIQTKDAEESIGEKPMPTNITFDLSSQENSFFTIKSNITCSDNTDNSLFLEAIKDIDVLIIHRTYLTKSYLGIDQTAFFKEIRNHIPFVIVDSGGTASNISLKTPYSFIPFGRINNNFGQFIQKLNFSQQILTLNK